MPFVHLHNHSEFSMLDGIAPIKKIAGRIRELGMPAYALTDHGVMYGAIPFYKACNDAGIKPIIGCEVYVAARRLTDRDPQLDRHSFHLTLLAKNLTGYRNLMKLVSLAHCEGMFYKPRVDFESLSLHAEGLICLSGCLNGPVSHTFLNSGEEAATALVERYASVFGGDYYIELQRHGIEEEDRVREYLLDIAKRKGIRPVATNDCHYIHKEDARAHDIALCIGTKTLIENEDRLRYNSPEYYIKSREEMAGLFRGREDALDITLEISDSIDVELPLGKVFFPKFDVPGERPETTHSELLRSLVFEGAAKRYGEPVPENIEERLNYELGVIEETGYPTYFLIVWDFIRFARSKDIPVGPGRGSGAGSCVAYCLEITDVDPIKFDLLFERFLNKDRITLPDFDIDFCMTRRDEVIEYVKEKYGADNVAQIVTFNHLKAKAVIKAVGRVMALPFAYVNEVTKKIPWGLNITIGDAVRESPDLAKMMDDDPQVKLLIEDAEKLEGLASHGGVHAAGIVIADGKLEDYVPVQKAADSDLRIAQYDLTVIEDAGLVKMDFLGLRTLTMLDEAVGLVDEFEGVKIDLRNLPLDDAKTFRLFQQGDTVGVFQFERDAVRRVLRESYPQTIEDISTINGLNRPGPSQHTQLYISNRRNPDSAKYVIPEIREVLEETAGIPIYQEQVMQAVRLLAGFTLGQADVMRWAMGKKKLDKMEKMKGDFIKGCAKNGISRAKAEEYFAMIETFAGYGFNKCHSLPYSIVSYQTAYIKAHYPKHFITALINSYLGNAEDTAKYVLEARRMGIKILPPDINRSVFKFRPEGEGVRFGLGAIKGLGPSAIHALTAIRETGEFKSVQDFVHRVDQRAVTRAVVEALVKAGAFDALESERGKLLSDLDRLCDRTNDPRQAGLFGAGDSRDALGVVSSRFTKAEISEFEHDVLGIYLTGHPMENAPVLNDENLMTPSAFFEWITDAWQSAEFTPQGRKLTVQVAGVVGQVEIVTAKSGNQYAKVKLGDIESTLNLLVFAKTLKSVRNLLVERNQVVVKGFLEFDSLDLDEETDFETQIANANIIVSEMSTYEAAGEISGGDMQPRESGNGTAKPGEGGNGGSENGGSFQANTAADGDIVISLGAEAFRAVDFHEMVDELTRGSGGLRVRFHITKGGEVLKVVNFPGSLRADRIRAEKLSEKYRYKIDQAGGFPEARA